MNECERLNEDLKRVKNRIHRWVDRYFPEFVPTVFKELDGKAALATLRRGLLPVDIAQMSPEQIVHMWKEAGVKRGVGLKAATRLVENAKKSVGLTHGQTMARQENKTCWRNTTCYNSNCACWRRRLRKF